MLTVWLTSTGCEGQWAAATAPLLEQFGAAFANRSAHRFTLASSPERSDVILFVEPEYVKLRSYLQVLKSQSLLRDYPNRCFVIDCADTAWGLIPGVYTNLRSGDTDVSRLRANGYLRFHNEQTAAASAWSNRVAPDLLFSFQGAESSHVRRRIFATLRSSQTTRIDRIDRWMNHSTDEKQSYLRTIARSRFVLCPAGNAPSSYRLYETMQMGRVPVIISDTWTPSDGPAWSEFSVRIHESRIGDLHTILENLSPHAEAMGAAARQAWEDWFSPDVIVWRMLGDIESILRMRPSGYDERQHRDWDLFRGQWRRGWTLPQRSAHFVTRRLCERA